MARIVAVDGGECQRGQGDGGIGDAAFCTGLSDAIMAGVLVRQGDRLVYALVGGAAEGQQVPDMESTPDGVVISPGLCALAQDLAREILN